jgi:hypothetical protein
MTGKEVIRYGALTSIVFVSHYLSTNKLFNLETITQDSPMIGWILLFLWYFTFILFGDMLIKNILKMK